MIQLNIEDGELLPEDSFQVIIKAVGGEDSLYDCLADFNLIHQFGIGKIIGNLSKEFNPKNFNVLFVRFERTEMKKINQLQKQLKQTKRLKAINLIALIKNNLELKDNFTILIS